MKIRIYNIQQGSRLTKKSSRNFATRYENLVTIAQILVAKSPRCIVLSAILQKNMSPQYLCLKKPLKMVNNGRNEVMHVTLQLNHPTQCYLQRKFTARSKTILPFLSFFIYFSKSSSKVATANPFVSKDRR